MNTRPFSLIFVVMYLWVVINETWRSINSVACNAMACTYEVMTLAISTDG